jgi:hypothetical protein
MDGPADGDFQSNSLATIDRTEAWHRTVQTQAMSESFWDDPV